MFYQLNVSDYPTVSFPGELHNVSRETYIMGTAKSDTVSRAGYAKVITGVWDHTRYDVEDPTTANLSADNRLVIVHRDRLYPMPYDTGFRIGDVDTAVDLPYPSTDMIRVLERGVIYVVVEKAIDPSNPVYIRVANPDASGQQAIGAFTDTADGANTVEITEALSHRTAWFGADSYSYLNSRSNFDLTAEEDARRYGLAAGYAIAPLRIAYS